MGTVTVTNIRRTNVLVQVGSANESSGSAARGVPDYTGAIRKDLMAYTDDTDFETGVTRNYNKNVVITKNYSVFPSASILGQHYSVDRGVLHNGHKVLSARIKGVSSSLSSSPPYISAQFDTGSGIDAWMYVAIKFDPGWSTRGSNGPVETYKLLSMGLASPSGRVGIEYTGGSGLSFVGGPGGGGIVMPSVYTNNLTGLDVSGSGAWGAGTGIPYNTDAMWVSGSTICVAIKVERVTSTTMRQKFWTWQYGTTPTVNPNVDVSFTLTSGTLLGVDRLSLGENFGQLHDDRYAPSPTDHHWCEWGIWNLLTHSNPINLE